MEASCGEAGESVIRTSCDSHSQNRRPAKRESFNCRALSSFKAESGLASLKARSVDEGSVRHSLHGDEGPSALH
jgi:hypothetical protein